MRTRVLLPLWQNATGLNHWFTRRHHTPQVKTERVVCANRRRPCFGASTFGKSLLYLLFLSTYVFLQSLSSMLRLFYYFVSLHVLLAFVYIFAHFKQLKL